MATYPVTQITERRLEEPCHSWKWFFLGIKPDRVTNDKLVRPLAVEGEVNYINNDYSNRKDSILYPSS